MRCKLTIEDPESPDSGQQTQTALAALRVRRTAQGLTFSWPIASGVFLEVSESLSGPWRPVGMPVLSEANSRTVQLTPTSVRAFYRLGKLP